MSATNGFVGPSHVEATRTASGLGMRAPLAVASMRSLSYLTSLSLSLSNQHNVIARLGQCSSIPQSSFAAHSHPLRAGVCRERLLLSPTHYRPDAGPRVLHPIDGVLRRRLFLGPRIASTRRGLQHWTYPSLDGPCCCLDHRNGSEHQLQSGHDLVGLDAFS